MLEQIQVINQNYSFFSNNDFFPVYINNDWFLPVMFDSFCNRVVLLQFEQKTIPLNNKMALGGQFLIHAVATLEILTGLSS